MIHALGFSGCQSGVPLVGMTSPNPINVVLLPKATQVHSFSLQQYSSVSAVKCARRYMGGLPHIRFVTTAIQKGSMHHTHQGPIMLSMTRHTAASIALFGLHHAYVMDSLYWKGCSIVTYEKLHTVKLLSTHFWTVQKKKK